MLQDIIEDICRKREAQDSFTLYMTATLEGLKQLHEEWGDEGFYAILSGTTVNTNLEGYEYVQNFLKQKPKPK